MNKTVLGIGHAMCDVVVNFEPRAWVAFREQYDWLGMGRVMHIEAKKAQTILLYFEKMAAEGKAQISCSAGGSALNALRVAAGLGMKASFAGCVGNDAYGDIIRSGLDAAKIEFLGTHGEYGQTGIFCTVSAGKSEIENSDFADHQILFACPAAARHVRDMDFTEFDLEKITLIHAEGLLADSPQSLEPFFQRAHDMKKMISLDMVSSEFVARNKAKLIEFIERYSDFVFCNRREFEALGVNIDNCRADITWVIKADKAGVECFWSGEHLHVDSPQCEVIDTLGAGDAFAGAFLSGILAGLPVGRCLQIGTKAAACALSSSGSTLNEYCLNALKEEILAG